MRIKLFISPVHMFGLLKRPDSWLTVSSYSREIHKALRSIQVFSSNQIKYNSLLKLLGESHRRVSAIAAPGEYSVKGDVISLWPLGYPDPVKASFFDQELESLTTYDKDYNRVITQLKFLSVINFFPELISEQSAFQIHVEQIYSSKGIDVFSNYLPSGIDLAEDIEVIQTDYTYPSLFLGRLDLASKELERYQEEGYEIAIITRHQQKLSPELNQYLLLPTQFPEFDFEQLLSLPAGFKSTQQKQLFLSDRELFGTLHLANEEAQDELTKDNSLVKLLKYLDEEISIGDFIVHEDYGVGVYRGIDQQIINNTSADYLDLEYGKGDHVLIPINQLNKITKYIGEPGVSPVLTKLGRAEWKQHRKQAQVAAGVIARELTQHYARRSIATGITINGEDSAYYQQFCAEFAHELTRDQHHCLNEILADLAQNKPMHRLLIGDVGFGKTEVFVRAAFKVIEAGGQIAVMCPTTVLAEQHFQVISQRFKNTKIKIAKLTRGESGSSNREIIDQLNSAEINLVVGTHRMLSSDLKFKQLGLLIIDEEQKFGVKQKEKLQTINYGVHQLSVSATPIPRTLSMALSSVQDISIIGTPPRGRRSIITELVKDDFNIVVNGIKNELDRGGQVYFVHNRVMSLVQQVTKLQKLLPGINIVGAHAQMSPIKLKGIMGQFAKGEIQILVSTTIVESGLDLPNVNTIIINQAHHFGLSQLHQLRGRVGRSDKQAYCYLYYTGRDINTVGDKKLKPKLYLERLAAIINNTDLGSGFRIASQDLELRGGGNFLGTEQSGKISSVGYQLFMKMVASAVKSIQETTGTNSNLQ